MQGRLRFDPEEYPANNGKKAIGGGGRLGIDGSAMRQSF
jgi:hypothetical protein